MQEKLGDLIDVLLKFLALLGGSGGIMYWLDRFRNRSRLRVRLIREMLNARRDGFAMVQLEVVNIGRDPTSLEHMASLTGYTPKGKKRTYDLEVHSRERLLPSHIPKEIELICRMDEVLPFLWFKRYRIVPTRGKAKELLLRSADNVRLSKARYCVEAIVFKFTGRAWPWGRRESPVSREI